MGLLPKEHGAYGQLAFPLATTLVITGANAPALWWALAVVFAFLAHEPLVVLLGRRGARLRRLRGRQAVVAAVITSVAALTGAAVAVSLAPSSVRWSFGTPLMPALFVAVACVRGVEKNTAGEVAVAIAFSLAALPAALTAGAPLGTALAIGLSYCVVFVAGTLAVRLVILRVRGGGNPRAVQVTRAAVLTIAMLAPPALWLAGQSAVIPWTPLAAVTPALVLSVTIALCPPPSTRLRDLGWSLVAATATAAAVLIAGLRAL